MDEHLTPERILFLLAEPVEELPGETHSGEAFALYDRLVKEAPLDSVIGALRRAVDPESRQMLCDVLGDRKEAAAVPALLGRLDAPEVGVRAAAAEAVGKVFGYTDAPPSPERRREVLGVLLARWEVEESDAVRSTLAQTLALLGDPAVRPVLEAAVDHPDRRVRGQARWGLDHLTRTHR